MTKKKILVADDESDLLYAVTLQLETNGFEVLSATDGQQALEKARKGNPDLIILDLMLPKIDGFKVCRMLRLDTRYKDIPIILFSARAQESDKKAGQEVGANAYVVKPFEPKVLLGKINELLHLT